MSQELEYVWSTHTSPTPSDPRLIPAPELPASRMSLATTSLAPSHHACSHVSQCLRCKPAYTLATLACCCSRNCLLWMVSGDQGASRSWPQDWCADQQLQVQCFAVARLWQASNLTHPYVPRGIETTPPYLQKIMDTIVESCKEGETATHFLPSNLPHTATLPPSLLVGDRHAKA